MIYCIVVEDELASQEILLSRIRSLYPEILIKACFRHKDEVLQFLSKHHVDLIFLDNHIIGGFGIQVLQQVHLPSTEIIFTTAYTDYAIDALNYGATYYLLKPFNEQQFKMAVDRALQRISERKRILMIGARQNSLVNLDEVMYIKSDGVYSEFIMSDSTKVISSRNIGLFETRLSIHHFYRIHHSYIVNLDFVMTVEKGPKPVVYLKDGTTHLPVSQRKAKAFYDTFGI